MSFFDYLDNLRAKPERTKVRIALSISLCVTGVIFGFWLMSFYSGSTNPEKVIAEVPVESPVASLMASAGVAFKDIGTQFNEVKNMVASFFTETYEVPSEEVPSAVYFKSPESAQ